MNREDFVKRFKEAKKRSLPVELEKFENEHSVGLETLVNKFLADVYSSYDTKETLVLSTLLTVIIPPGEWKRLDNNPYSTRYVRHSSIEYKEEKADSKKEESIWYKRTRERTTYTEYDGLHDVLKIFVKDLLIKKGYFIIEKIEPSFSSGDFYQDSQKYLEVYYDEQIYNDEYRGFNHDVKALVKEVERLLVAVKKSNE